MPCVHMKQVINLCKENEVKISGLDVIRLVCTKCNVKEVCPAVLTDEYDEIERSATAVSRSMSAE